MHRILIFLLFSTFNIVLAQNFTLSGYVKDSSSRETITKAQITVTINGVKYTPTELRSTTNGYGFYSLTVPAGKHNLIVTAPSYAPLAAQLDITNNLEYNILLSPDVEGMGTVTIRSKRNNNVKSLDISTQNINGQTIKKIPAFLGEADVIKSIQLDRKSVV